MRHHLLLGLLATLPLVAIAAEPDRRAEGGFQSLPEPPPPPQNYRGEPPAVTPDEELEPEVTITTRGEDRYEEYRLHGKLYMVKVIPRSGPAYYLIDTEGKGQFMRSDFAPRISPPMWVIKRF